MRRLHDAHHDSNHKQMVNGLTAVTCESLQRMDSRTCPMDTRAAVPRGLPNAPRMPVCKWCMSKQVEWLGWSALNYAQAAAAKKVVGCS
jgi:hypothetical protein